LISSQQTEVSFSEKPTQTLFVYGVLWTRD
jgi:hypothetical protein